MPVTLAFRTLGLQTVPAEYSMFLLGFVMFFWPKMRKKNDPKGTTKEGLGKVFDRYPPINEFESRQLASMITTWTMCIHLVCSSLYPRPKIRGYDRVAATNHGAQFQYPYIKPYNQLQQRVRLR